jgi:hypothetical protein
MGMSLPAKALVPQPDLLTLKSVEPAEAGWVVAVDGPDEGTCLACGQKSRSRHSRYVRILRDLPIFGAVVSLKVNVSRWRCRNSECKVRFFADGLVGVADSRSRRTCRADAIIRSLGQALGGLPGQRLAKQLGVPVSDDTILRRLKQSAGAHLRAARMQAAGYNWRFVEMSDTACFLKVYYGGEELGTIGYTIEEAKRAGLAGKDIWKNNPSDMLFARAITRAQRRFAPAALKGQHILDLTEVEDLTVTDPVQQATNSKAASLRERLNTAQQQESRQ